MAITVPTDAYATLAEVLRFIPRRTFSSTSTPLTDTGAEALVMACAQEIDAAIEAHGYTVPQTGTTAIKRLKTVNCYGAALLIESAIQNAINPGGQVQGPAATYGPLYRDALKALRADTYNLGSTSPAATTPPAGNPDLYEDGDDGTPAFTRDMRF